MFEKLLVANRGEIACRIIRAAKELDVRTVAIHSDVEPTATHVKIADESHQIGRDPLDTYLNMERIVALAKQVGADGIHPGYGFLAENPEFAALCEDEGLCFVGPSARLIELLGVKSRAKEVMRDAGLPVVPGSDGDVGGEDEALELAREVGYPVLLKASAGGGGRGIRICRDAKQLRESYQSASNEAAAAFGSGDLLLEKYIEGARHIEFQLLGDNFGNLIHLWDRDCSIQRRNQKLIEIGPSLLLDDQQRRYYGGLAVEAAKKIGYRNAGTMEFIADGTGNLYFIEMNTRIQVEHPVSEMITGIDIVKWQLKIAAGHQLTYRQEDVRLTGNAIECRINAEDPKTDFTPSLGTIERYYVPGGFGIRVEHAAARGFEVTPYYDSLIAKIIVWGPRWSSAVTRMLSALETYEITGVRTTIPVLINTMREPDFQAGRFDTGYIAEHPELLEYSEHRNKEDYAAFLSAAVAAYHGL